jgi:hypothetical protein
MYNDSLDGIDAYLQVGNIAVLSHVDVVQYLLGDASAHVFKNRPLVYDTSFGPERLQEVCARYNVCFPNALLHKWLAKDKVDTLEAQDFLSNPTVWASNYQGHRPTITLANVPNVALVSDVVGVWGGVTRIPPSG